MKDTYKIMSSDLTLDGKKSQSCCSSPLKSGHKKVAPAKEVLRWLEEIQIEKIVHIYIWFHQYVGDSAPVVR